MKNKEKLSIKKETISHLSNVELSNVRGGEEHKTSTNHRFTCGLCTKVDTKDLIPLVTTILK